MKTINTHMKRTTAVSGALLAAMLLLMTGCKQDTATSLYNPNYVGGAQPVVTSILSSNGSTYFAGVSTITINGSNFSATPTEDLVYFDATKATVLSATTTQLIVKAPVLVKDSVILSIAVQGAAKYSDGKMLNLSAAVADYGKFAGTTDEAVGIATDNAGNLYASMKISGAGNGIRKYIVGPDTGFSYAPSGGVTSWSGLKVGPGGVLFGARVARALYTLPQGANPVVWAQVAIASFTDIDFDNLGYLWAVGNNTDIYRFKVSDKSVTSYPFSTNKNPLRTVRVFNGYVYVGGNMDGTEGVWRYKLNADGSVGAQEAFFNLSAQPGYGTNGPTINAITFDTDGDMYLATPSADAILVVAPDGKSYKPLYPGLFTPTTISLAWGKGSTLFAVRTNGTTNSLVKINTLKSGAPYYGAQ